MAVTLHVCVTCRAGEASDDASLRPGRRLHDRLAAEDAGWLQVSATQCLAACTRGCALAISAPGKWSYLLGGLGEGDAADLVSYARIYAASQTGVVMPSKRPASLQSAVLGRLPPVVFPEEGR